MEKFEIYYPVKPNRVNQLFGANATSVYIGQGLKGHPGIDFFAKHGQPVYATHDGICFPEIDNDGGNGVVIKTEKQYDYNGTLSYFKSIYWHLVDDDAVVHTGQKVKAGDLIGYADNTGISTGTHLHFAIKPCGINEADWSWFNSEQHNGYNGAIDPMSYFNGKFAEDINNPSVKYQFKKLLRRGSWNDEVKQLQILLGKLGLYSGVDDGVFGPKTYQAVIHYQDINKLIPDGIVGPKTRESLNK